jgi:hypothetical protein
MNTSLLRHKILELPLLRVQRHQWPDWEIVPLGKSGDDVGVRTCQTTHGKVPVPRTPSKSHAPWVPVPRRFQRRAAATRHFYPASHQRLRKGRRGEASRPAQHLLPIQTRGVSLSTAVQLCGEDGLRNPLEGGRVLARGGNWPYY